jgi:hypothetical protein
MAINRSAKLALLCGASFLMATTYACAQDDIGRRAPNVVLIPLPKHCVRPDSGGLLLTVGYEASLGRAPGRNQIERTMLVIRNELQQARLVVLSVRTETDGDERSFAAALLRLVWAHVVESSGTSRLNRGAWSVSVGRRNDDGSVDRQIRIRENAPDIHRRYQLHEETIWCDPVARLVRISGTCAVRRMLPENGSPKASAAMSLGTVAGFRFDLYLGTVQSLGAFALTVDLGLVHSYRNVWNWSVKPHLKVGINWYNTANCCIQWEINFARSTLSRRVELFLEQQ